MSRAKPGASEPERPIAGVSRFARIAVVLTAAALALRLRHLTTSSFWIDETFQSFAIHGSWRFFVRLLAGDAVHPPLDYLVDRLPAALGVPPLELRILPAIWGSLTVPVLGLLVRRRVGELEAVLTMALLAAGPHWISISRDLRPYALGLLFLAGAVLMLDRALERPTAGRIAAFGIASASVVFTLYLAAVQLAVAAALLLAEDFASPDRNGKVRRVLRALPWVVGAVAAAFLPWALLVSSQHTPRFRAPADAAFGPASVIRAFATYSFSHRTVGYSAGSARLFQAIVGGLALFAAAGLLALVRKEGTRWLALWIPGGTLVLAVLGLATPFRPNARYLVAAWFVLPAVIGTGLAWLWRRRPAAGVASFTAAVAVEVVGVAAGLADRRVDWTRLTALLRHVPASESIYCDGTNSLYPVAHALCGPRWLDDHLCRWTLVDLAEHPDALDRRERSRRGWIVVSGREARNKFGRPEAAERRWSFPEAEGSELLCLAPDPRISAPVPSSRGSARALRRNRGSRREGSPLAASAPEPPRGRRRRAREAWPGRPPEDRQGPPHCPSAG